jgi:hypothetical protein
VIGCIYLLNKTNSDENIGFLMRRMMIDYMAFLSSFLSALNESLTGVPVCHERVLRVTSSQVKSVLVCLFVVCSLFGIL